MKKINQYIQSYLFMGIPFVIAIMTWASFQKESEVITKSSWPIQFLWQILSWNCIFWFAFLIIFLILIIFVPTVREQFISRIANIKERDEREQQITGAASRSVFISSLAISIFLLFLSVFTLSVTKNTNDQLSSRKNGMLYLELNMKFIDDPRQKTNNQGDVIFESNELPLSKSAILLLLIIWQLGWFRYSSRQSSIQD